MLPPTEENITPLSSLRVFLLFLSRFHPSVGLCSIFKSTAFQLSGLFCCKCKNRLRHFTSQAKVADLNSFQSRTHRCRKKTGDRWGPNRSRFHMSTLYGIAIPLVPSRSTLYVHTTLPSLFNTLPSKSNTTANIGVKCFVLLTKLISR